MGRMRHEDKKTEKIAQNRENRKNVLKKLLSRATASPKQQRKSDSDAS